MGWVKLWFLDAWKYVAGATVFLFGFLWARVAWPALQDVPLWAVIVAAFLPAVVHSVAFTTSLVRRGLHCRKVEWNLLYVHEFPYVRESLIDASAKAFVTTYITLCALAVLCGIRFSQEVLPGQVVDVQEDEQHWFTARQISREKMFLFRDAVVPVDVEVKLSPGVEVISVTRRNTPLRYRNGYPQRQEAWVLVLKKLGW